MPQLEEDVEVECSYSRRLRIWESNYGRDFGWIIERRGVPMAVLTDCRFLEMFWDSYQMTPLTDDPQTLADLQSEAFWLRAEAEGVAWRSREFGIVVPAFPALTPFYEPGRLIMRRLYILIAEPTVWDRVVMWLRKYLQIVK